MKKMTASIYAEMMRLWNNMDNDDTINSYSDIATKLGISYSTVYNYINGITKFNDITKRRRGEKKSLEEHFNDIYEFLLVMRKKHEYGVTEECMNDNIVHIFGKKYRYYVKKVMEIINSKKKIYKIVSDDDSFFYIWLNKK